jgi:hypothetical protein
LFFFRQSEQNEDSDLEKKRRSSFAASFYSSPNALRPKSERSLRRSSSSRSINYDEDRPEVQEARPEVREARPEVEEAIPEVQETRPEVHEAKPKSERSLRRSSNSRSINYDEEDEQVKNVGKEDRLKVHEARPEVHEAKPEVKETNSKSPIRRKKHYLNEQNNLIDISEEGIQNRVHTGSSKPKERYSNNELRKTQNEQLNIICRNLDSQ